MQVRVHLPSVRAAAVAQDPDPVRGRAPLGERRRLVAIVSGAVDEHADGKVQPHTLTDADRELVTVVAFVAQDSDRLVHAVALRVAHGAISIVARFVPQQAHAVVVAHALREHLGLVDVVAGFVAQDSDPAAEHRPEAERRPLSVAQAAAAIENVVEPGGQVSVVPAPVPQKAHAPRQAEPLAPGAQAVSVVAAKIHDRAKAERGGSLAEQPRFVGVVAREIDDHRSSRDRRAQSRARHRVAVLP